MGREETSPMWHITRGRRIMPAPFLVAAIVNVTPDSFSDGGRFFTPGAALSRVVEAVEEGAHIIDLGAESTRPGSEDIGFHKETARLGPVLEGIRELRAAGTVPEFHLSVDTWRAATAAASLEAGADIINDVSGGCFDEGMFDVLAQYKPGYVLGHSPARPQVMQQAPQYDHVVETLLAFFEDRMACLVRAGLPEGYIVLDPCIGFGKNLEHNLAIIRAVPRFLELGRPLYFGISRKSFLGELTGLPVGERGPATQIVTALLAEKGVRIHRVHEVAATVQTLSLVASIG